MSNRNLPCRQEVYKMLKARSLEIQSEKHDGTIPLRPPQPPHSGWDFEYGDHLK